MQLLSNDILLLTTLKGGSGGGGQRELRESSSAIAYKAYCPHNFFQDCSYISRLATDVVKVLSVYTDIIVPWQNRRYPASNSVDDVGQLWLQEEQNNPDHFMSH